MAFWRRRQPAADDGNDDGDDTASVDASELKDGDLKFIIEKGGNDSPASYQEATGAPVEAESPLGYDVGPITIIFLNVSKMIGTGVYSTREPTLGRHS